MVQWWRQQRFQRALHRLLTIQAWPEGSLSASLMNSPADQAKEAAERSSLWATLRHAVERQPDWLLEPYRGLPPKSWRDFGVFNDPVPSFAQALLIAQPTAEATADIHRWLTPLMGEAAAATHLARDLQVPLTALMPLRSVILDGNAIPEGNDRPLAWSLAGDDLPEGGEAWLLTQLDLGRLDPQVRDHGGRQLALWAVQHRHATLFHRLVGEYGALDQPAIAATAAHPAESWLHALARQPLKHALTVTAFQAALEAGHDATERSSDTGQTPEQMLRARRTADGFPRPRIPEDRAMLQLLETYALARALDAQMTAAVETEVPVEPAPRRRMRL